MFNYSLKSGQFGHSLFPIESIYMLSTIILIVILFGIVYRQMLFSYDWLSVCLLVLSVLIIGHGELER